ncbi:MAG: o-succinylbenzoate synthase [Bacteroidota bacterium]
MKIFDEDRPGVFGLGECAPLSGLSPEDLSQMDFELERLQGKIGELNLDFFVENPLEKVGEVTDPAFPSIRFGIEMAVLDLLNGGERLIFHNPFWDGQQKIPINGLIWMGDKQFMSQQLEEKLSAGFSCIKMKVGAIDLEEELALLKVIRKAGGNKLDLRIDANGAFPNNSVFKILKRFEALQLHSIEQPIMPRQPEAMSLVCEKSPIPIALDEDLIGVHRTKDREELLDYIKPQYIVIKPSLVGGLLAAKEWIRLAEERQIGWWITSALESNVGLNAIAQLTANYEITLPQGLGTGQLYHNNIPSPLEISDGFIRYDRTKNWGLEALSMLNHLGSV